jgi:hypothetical protein
VLVRIDRLIYRARFAAGHESAVGPSRRLACAKIGDTGDYAQSDGEAMAYKVAEAKLRRPTAS